MLISNNLLWILSQDIIGMLLTDFFPHEPCAAGLDLCPLGYRIPALESELRNILLKGWSYLAEDMVGWFCNLTLGQVSFIILCYCCC